MNKRLVKVFLICLLIGGLYADRKGFALPVFARKYNTTCQTCHTAFPNLNPFGEAFKRNGFRFPGEGTDFDSADQMPLGDEADAKKFPKAVWPGALPKTVPVAVTAVSEFASVPKDDATNQKAQFQTLGGDFGLFSAGTMGKHFGFFGGVELEANVDLDTGEKTWEVGVDRAYLVINPLHDHSSLVIRAGSFEPHLLNVSEHRSLLGGYFALNDETIGDNKFTLEGSQQGIEFGGVLAKGRLGYTASVVEGTDNRYNNSKDFYGRLEYKFGGLRLDGVRDKHFSTVKHPWRDDSVMIGAFGYQGYATLASDPAAPPVVTQKDRFNIFGGDVTLNYSNFITTLAYFRNQNNSPTIGSTASVGTNQFLADINYVWYWFIPGIRYEVLDNALASDQRITVGSTFLVRPNIKASLLGSLFKTTGGSFTDNPEIHAVLAMAF